MRTCVLLVVLTLPCAAMNLTASPDDTTPATAPGSSARNGVAFPADMFSLRGGDPAQRL